jgi:hypothetical protein
MERAGKGTPAICVPIEALRPTRELFELVKKWKSA